MNEFNSTANLKAIDSLSRRMKAISGCRKGQDAALREPVDAARQREVQRLRAMSQHRLQALQKERQIREELAEAQTSDREQTSPIVRALLGHIKKYPLYYGALKVASDPLFQCGAGLKKQQSPAYRIKMDLEGKKKRRKERFSLIRDARSKASKMADGKEKRKILKAADDFTRNIDAAEKAHLSRDVYHHTDEQISAEGAPIGYLRGSENPSILKRYGISAEMLRPPNSKFRGELYIPDPDVFGADAKPTLVFKGTDLTCLDDIVADVVQAGGKPSSYYKQAINLGNVLSKSTNGGLESAGHSLGGGMASAVGVITGCPTTTFNPAGLHPNTVAQQARQRATDGSNISDFIVEGEILNSGQDAANRAGRKMVISSAQSTLPLLISPSRLAPLIIGTQLSSVPSHVGIRETLSADNGTGSPNVLARHLMDTVIAAVERVKKQNQTVLKNSLLPNRRASYGTEHIA